MFHLQASGLAMLIIGIWMISQLHKYVDTESWIATTLPITFLSLAAAILVLAILACCCTAKGQVPLLYMVRKFSKNDRVKATQGPSADALKNHG